MSHYAPFGAHIEATYRTIAETRMAGIPIVNPVIGVSMRGLQRQGENLVGILVTPWFMNLVFVPLVQPEGQAVPRVGSARGFVLPSGCYEALAGYEEGIGWHWSCSLFSPMFEFGDMDSAEQTADVSLDLILTAPDGTRGNAPAEEGEREDFRTTMVAPHGAGGVEQRLDAMATREAAARIVHEERAAQAATGRVSGPGLDRRRLFGLGRAGSEAETKAGDRA